ncbi:MAG: PssD/Cps14F family polysaccharide biosynthesis glycosyltransferase [Acidimicrobiales bacterium]
MTEISERPDHTVAESNLTDHVAPGLAGSIALLVGSSGGHLDHLVRLEPWWRSMERAWVTFDLPDARSRLAEETAYWAYHPTTRSAKNLVRNMGLARRVLREVQPDVVISTGAGLAVPFFVIARSMGIPTVFLEVFDRVSSRTLTGRLCHPLSTRFLVQWPEQERLYPGSINVGSIYP